MTTLQELDELITAAESAADHDSNDGEIEALKLALDTAVEMLRNVKVQVLHQRDPDSGCHITVYIDDAPVDVEEENIDPGAGYERSDWDERIAEAAKDVTEFGQAVSMALESHADSEYIHDND